VLMWTALLNIFLRIIEQVIVLIVIIIIRIHILGFQTSGGGGRDFPASLATPVRREEERVI
jgi:hypothetical protein